MKQNYRPHSAKRSAPSFGKKPIRHYSSAPAKGNSSEGEDVSSFGKKPDRRPHASPFKNHEDSTESHGKVFNKKAHRHGPTSAFKRNADRSEPFGKPFGKKTERRTEGASFGKKFDRSSKPRPAFSGKNDRLQDRTHDRSHDRTHDRTHERPKPKFADAAKKMDAPNAERNSVTLWGLHAVRAAWLNPKRRCYRIWLTEAGRASFEKTMAEAEELLLKRPDVKIVTRPELDQKTPPGTVHQGILLEAGFLPEPTLHDIIGVDQPPELLIMLDQVTDPHNVGAILRSASAFGAGAVILTERNAPSVTGVLAKSASGAADHMPQVHVVNLARALDELQEAGYWRIGLAEEGTQELSALDLSGRTVLVMGAEGEGLRQLTRKKCDELARLPTAGPIESLNVSNAAAVALYEIRRQKKPFGHG